MSEGRDGDADEARTPRKDEQEQVERELLDAAQHDLREPRRDRLIDSGSRPLTPFLSAIGRRTG